MPKYIKNEAQRKTQITINLTIETLHMLVEICTKNNCNSSDLFTKWIKTARDEMQTEEQIKLQMQAETELNAILSKE